MDRLPSGAVQRVGGGSFVTLNAPGSAGLPAVTEQTAQSVAAINACVKLLAGAVSSLPMNIYSMDFTNGAKSQLWGDPLWWLLNEQWAPQWSAAAGWDHLMRSRLYHGDAYAAILRNRAGDVMGLRPVSKSRVVTYEMMDGRLVYGVFPDAKSINLAVEYYDQDDFIHVPGDGFDGIASPSVLQFELRSAGGVALSAQQQTGQFFVNGMMPGVVITSPAKPSPDEMKLAREQMAERYGGVRNSFVPLLLYGGADAKTLTVTPEDAQLLESRKFQVEEIARIYGVPPFMIGHNEKTTSWGSGVEAMGSGFVRYTLRRHLHAITNEFNRKLFRRGGNFCEFDTSDLERPSFKDFMDALRTGVGRAGERPIMTQNEARGRFNLPPVPGGDDAAPLAGAPTQQEGAANE
ncbi:phage portal protein [Sandarakinorhabdus sp.]|uniref:phage portal protein n=1 Tax=Sandarakinorhabdus sp. TaxID=1916663 RepID=UPI0028A90BA4|nr:phage portal protein [Sandarakinorhabdus sp.]